MLRKWGALVLLLLATPILAYSQSTGKLAGQVVDAAGDPLPGANVVLEGTTLGTATDVDGNYFIIGVPVGTYDVQASFVGFQSSTVSNVEIISGYTREINFQLNEGTELGEIFVEYERPLIQKDAIGSPKVISGEDIANLPVRGAASLAALQGGVISNEGSSALNIRGGREQEVTYYVDGVKVIGQIGVPDLAIQEQEVLVGTIPARYGDALSGVISITTKSGQGAQRFFGSVEAITSEVLDDFGYNTATVTLGGPLVGNKLSFFLAAEGQLIGDASPYSTNTFRVDDATFDALQANPQVLQITTADGEIDYVSIPGNLEDGVSEDDLVAALNLPEGASINSFNPIAAPFTFTGEEGFFSRDQGKDDEFKNIDFTGNFTFSPAQGISLRLGGGYTYDTRDAVYNFSRSLYNRNFNTSEDQTARFFATFRQYLSGATFYQVQAEYTDDRDWDYPSQFSRELDDLIRYGDIDDPANATLASYKTYNSSEGIFEQQFNDGNTWGAGTVNQTFRLPGSNAFRTTYSKDRATQFRLSASATTQIGIHQVEFGGEYEQATIRRFAINAAGLARYICDEPEEEDCGAEQGDGFNSYSEIPFEAFEAAAAWYGYDFRGQNEVDDQDIGAYAAFSRLEDQSTGNESDANIAPYRPIYYAGYISDKIEYKDLVISLGLRADIFDNNTTVLRDELVTVPVVRAGAAGIANRPGNIGDDFVVYYNSGRVEDGVAGYRDGDRYFDATGASIASATLNNAGSPIRAPNASELDPSVFTDYEPEVTFMPRIGVSFPVTDRALFFASYNVTSQRPTERNFVPFTIYDSITGQARINNPNLEPEKTIQYELGFRQAIGQRAALQISGFLRNQNNKINIRNVQAFPSGYGVYQNGDFTTTKGLEFEFDLRRTNNVSLRTNYTLSFAQGTGSDSQSLIVVQWRSSLGEYYPNFISPAAFDRRHAINVTLDYRLGEGEGPMVGGTHLLENFGVNIIGNIGSGQPYTQLVGPSAITDSFTDNVFGDINAARMPWSSLINLRVDRRFTLGANTALTAFVWVQNLLDQDNVYGVYRFTGEPDEDGFLSSPGGINAVRNAATSFNDPAAGDAFAFHYGNFIDSPISVGGNAFSSATGQRYGSPRRIRLGVRLSF